MYTERIWFSSPCCSTVRDRVFLKSKQWPHLFSVGCIGRFTCLIAWLYFQSGVERWNAFVVGLNRRIYNQIVPELC
jgi:hypothetical protein